MRKRLSFSVATLGVAVAAVVAVGLATASAQVAHHSPASQSTLVRTGASLNHRSRAHSEAALVKHYKVLARARVADVPSDTQIANPRVVAFLGLKVADTELMQTSSGPVWIVPGTNGACVVTGQTAPTPAPQFGANFTNCADATTVLQSGLVARASTDDGNAFVYGIVPNGNSTVTVTPSSGASQAIPVIDNTFKAAIPQTGSLTVSFTNAANAAHVSSFRAW